MNLTLPTLALLLGKLGTLLVLVAVLDAWLTRAEPRWRQLLLRAAVVATPVLLLAEFGPPLFQLPSLWSNSPPAEPITILVEPVSAIPSAAAPVAVASATRNWGSPLLWMIVTWAAVASAILIRDGIRMSRLKGAIRHTRSAETSVRQLWDSVTASYQLEPVPLRVCGDRQSPYLVPGFRHQLIIPACLIEADSELLEHVFRHEAAHLANRDPLWIPAYRVFAAVLWICPPAWWLMMRHLRACEEVCDAEAARRGGTLDYSASLAELALMLLPIKTTNAVAFLRAPSVRKRLKALPYHVDKRPPQVLPALLASMALLLTSGAIGNLAFAQSASGTSTKTEVAKPKRDPNLLYTHVYKWPLTDFQKAQEVTKAADAKAILQSAGIAFGDGASAIYNQSTHQLIIRNKGTELEKVESYLNKRLGIVLGNDNALAKHLSGITIPKIEFRQTKLQDAVDTLSSMTMSLDASKKGLKIEIDPSINAEQPITFNGTSITAYEALRACVALTETHLWALDESSVLIVPRPITPGNTAAPVRAATDLDKVLRSTIVKEVKFDGVPLGACLNFLAARAGPEKKINMVIKEVDLNTQITLRLTNIPLSEALRYTTQLARATYKVEDNAVVIQPEQ